MGRCIVLFALKIGRYGADLTFLRPFSTFRLARRARHAPPPDPCRQLCPAPGPGHQVPSQRGTCPLMAFAPQSLHHLWPLPPPLSGTGRHAAQLNLASYHATPKMVSFRATVLGGQGGQLRDSRHRYPPPSPVPTRRQLILSLSVSLCPLCLSLSLSLCLSVSLSLCVPLCLAHPPPFADDTVAAGGR